MTENFNFSQLLIARICHDLASPVGAICNGTELINEDSSKKLCTKTLELITENSMVAAVRLKFFRFVFGNSNSDGETDLNEIKVLCDDYFKSYKLSLIWETENTGGKYVQLTKFAAQLTLLLIMLSSEVLIYGGTVIIKVKKISKGKFIEVSGSGNKIKVHPHILKLFDKKKLSELTFQNIIVYYVNTLISKNEIEGSSEINENSFAFTIKF